MAVIKSPSLLVYQAALSSVLDFPLTVHISRRSRFRLSVSSHHWASLAMGLWLQLASGPPSWCHLAGVTERGKGHRLFWEVSHVDDALVRCIYAIVTLFYRMFCQARTQRAVQMGIGSAFVPDPSHPHIAGNIQACRRQGFLQLSHRWESAENAEVSELSALENLETVSRQQILS